MYLCRYRLEYRTFNSGTSMGTNITKGADYQCTPTFKAMASRLMH